MNTNISHHFSQIQIILLVKSIFILQLHTLNVFKNDLICFYFYFFLLIIKQSWELYKIIKK